MSSNEKRPISAELLRLRQPWCCENVATTFALRARWLLTLPAFAYTTWIFIAGTGPAGPELQQYNDKLLHFMGFALCVWLYALALLAFGSALGPWRLTVSWSGAVAVGVGLEIWQSFVPARSADWGDVLADVAGATTAILALKLLQGRWPWTVRRV